MTALTPAALPGTTPVSVLSADQQQALALTGYSPKAQAQYRQRALVAREQYGLELMPFPCLNCNAAPADETGHCSDACEQAFGRGF